MSVRHFHKCRSGLLRTPSSSHTTYPLICTHVSEPHVGTTISSNATTTKKSYLHLSSTSNFQTHRFHHFRSSTITERLGKPQSKARSISTLNVTERGKASPKQDGEEGEEEEEEEEEEKWNEDDENLEANPPTSSFWNSRFPEIHAIQVKHNKGKATSWESLKAILTQHRDTNHRQRRMWISFSGSEPTRQELTLEWPPPPPQDNKKSVVTRRKLRDQEEDLYYSGSAELDGPGEFIVTERTSTDGRRFWREVIKRGELNDEEEARAWKDMMREEGFDKEIERQMDKF